MQCPRCRADNRDDFKFCAECGSRLAVACPSCGAEIGPAQRFCGACGTALGSPQPGGRFATPESYTPKYLAERILTSRGALEGERKQVTVLFADLKGSMELLADRDPEDARRLLDPVIAHMIEAVHRYEGTVNQVMGDGIMALFGAPLAHEDHAVRACYAALRMQDAVNRYAEGVRREEGVSVRMRVGLNSGEVVVRGIRSDLRMEYTALGQTTHLAARMEQLAEPGTSLLTAATLALAESFVRVKALGPVRVKGLGEAIEVYELTGASTVRSRLQAHESRGLTAFVGRTAEITELSAALDHARTGRGQVVGVVGEPGVGKSRLYWELARSHRTDGCLVLQATSVSYGKTTPYLPVIDLLKGYFKIDARDDTRAIRAKVTGTLLTLDEALRDALAPALWLLDALAADDPFLALEPRQRRLLTLDALKRILLRESRVQPLVVIFEDLHWIDSETQAFLDALVASVPKASMLLAVNYRPEYGHEWAGKTYYRQLRIDPLPPEGAAELLRALLGPDPSVAPLERLLIERTEGNPFFLEENVRTLVETGVLVGERGAHRLARPVEDVHVPATVQAVLAARIDRLPPDDKAVLQTASVIGKDVPLALLQDVMAQAAGDLPARLVNLQAAEFLYETKLFPDPEYTFKHALTREVAYDGLLNERKRALHARILDVIETVHGDRLAEHADALAHHAFRAEAWEKALVHLRSAGRKALGHSANREAARNFEQALVALAHVPADRLRLEEAIDLRFDLRTALLPLGEFGRIAEHLREAEALAGSVDDRRRLARAGAYSTDYFRQIGDYERAVGSGQRALEIAESLGDGHLQVATNLYLGQAHHNRGDYGPAARFFRRNIEALAGTPASARLGLPYLPAVHSRTWLVMCLAELGEFVEAQAWAEEGLRLAQAENDPFSLVSAHWGLGRLYLRMGDPEAARPVLERGIELSRVWDIPLLSPALTLALGSTHALAGRVADALPLLEEAARRHASIRRTAGESPRLTSLGHVYLMAGRRDEAVPLAQRGLALARQHGERGNEAWALRLLGEMAAQGDSPDVPGAEDAYLESLAIAWRLEMRPLAAHGRLELGTLYRAHGNPAKAREQLAAAVALFETMGMRRFAAAARSALEAPG